MAIIFTVAPHILDQGHVAWIESFRLSVTVDGDLWPHISRTPYKYRPDQNDQGGFCGGRYRMPFIGGGSSEALFMALRELEARMKMDEAGLDEVLPDMFGGKYPHKAKPYVERHMDDDCGYFGIEILEEGSVRLRCRPLPGDPASMGETDTHILMPPDTPYWRSYDYMPKLRQAIEDDNRMLGAFAGHHS